MPAKHLQAAQELLGADPYGRLVAEIEEFAIFLTDTEGVIRTWNAGAHRLFGYDESEITGQNAEVLFTLQDREAGAVQDEMSRARETGRSEDVRWHLRKNGSRFFTNGFTTALHDESGTLRAFVKIARDSTRRHEIEAERELLLERLTRTETRYRSFLTATTETIWSADPDGGLHILEKWTEMTGEPPQNSIGWGWLDMVHPDDQERVRQVWSESLRTATPYEAEFRVRDPEGVYGWTAARAVPLFNPDGSVREWVGVGSDVTARKQAEQERERFFGGLSVGTELLMIGGFDGRLRWVSPAWERTLGWTFEELTTQPWLTFVHPDDHAVTIEAGASVAQGHALLAFENRYLHRDGSVRWLRWRAQPYPEEALLYGGATDVTEQKIAEAALRESEQQFRTLADTLPQLAWISEADGHIFWYNRRWFDYTGTTLEEMQGWGWQSVHDPNEVERVKEGFRVALQTGAPWEDTFPLRSKTGEYRWFLSRAMPMRNEEGQISRWFGTNTDVEEFRRAKREADESNRLKDEFLATLSHELRTPLTSMLGWTQLLRSGKLDEETSEQALESIERNARAQSQLVNDILDVSRIVSGKLHLEMRQIDVAQAIDGAIDAVRPAASAKDIRLAIDLDPRASLIVGDINRLQQIAWNLLSNAIKFTPKGGRVAVSLDRVESSVQLSVSDSGQGIAPEFLPHVFDRFRQADSSSTRAHGGLGLGLAIVRQLVELHGGTVEVQSEGIGQGATFRVRFPLSAVVAPALDEARDVPESAPDSARATTSPSDAATPPPNFAPQPGELSNLRVLIVDDEADARTLVRTVLESVGAIVISSSSASQALHLLDENTPDVLVSDIGMPGLDGYALITQWRAREAERGCPPLPAVALTAFARSEDRVRALRAGFDIHVPKPVEPSELIAVVAHLARKTPAQ